MATSSRTFLGPHLRDIAADEDVRAPPSLRPQPEKARSRNRRTVWACAYGSGGVAPVCRRTQIVSFLQDESFFIPIKRQHITGPEQLQRWKRGIWVRIAESRAKRYIRTLRLIIVHLDGEHIVARNQIGKQITT